MMSMKMYLMDTGSRAAQQQPPLARLSWNNYVAYVTQLGFYAFYIDCHHVTLTDRKKVVNRKDRIPARPALEYSNALTHTRDQARALGSGHSLRMSRDRCCGCCCRVKSQRALRVDLRVVWVVRAVRVAQVASSRKKNIKIRLPFWY